MRRVSLLLVAVLGCAGTSETRPALRAGDSLYVAGEYAGARTAYRNELAQSAEPSRRAHLLTSISLSAYHLSDFDEARRTGDSALALMGSSAPLAELFRVHNALGLIAWQQGRLASADSFFRNALQLANSAHDTSALAKAYANLALVLTDYGEFPEARSALIAAREMAHASGNARTEGNAYTNLAMLSLRTGDVADAEQNVKRALSVYRAAHYETGAQNALGQLATIEAAKGDPQAAFAAVDSALVIVRKEELKQEEASDYQILGDLYADAGDLRSSSLYYDRAERAFAASGIDLEAANLMRARADLDAAHGDTAGASKRALAALAIHAKLGARAEMLNDRLAIADLVPSSAAGVIAERQLDSADALSDSLGTRVALVRTVLARARYEEGRGRPREVLRVLARARETEQLDYGSRWQLSALRLRAWARLGRLDSAEVAGQETIRLVERSRRSYGSAALRTTYTARMAQVYTDFVLVLLRRGNVARAFEIADAARGRALVEHLATARAALASNSAPALFVDAEVLASRIDSLVTRLEAADRAGVKERGIEEQVARRDLADRLARVRTEYEAKLARANSGDDAELLGLTTVGTPRVQSSLREHEALLDYLLTHDTLLTFVVTADRVTVVRSAVREEDVIARARIVRELLGVRTATANGAPAAEALYDLLIAPVRQTAALTGVERLVIVPHEALAYVPFAALRDRSTGRMLVQQYVLSYLPSAAALPILRGRSTVMQQGSGATDGPESVALAPFSAELPASASEARRFGERVPNATTRLGGAATERALRTALAAGGVVHVATHAELNVRNPMFSQIRLAPGKGRNDDDGRLEVYEIFGMHVRSPLVFLSGCETGAGSAWSSGFQRGEDYATLARAFLYAGARNVIATLWPIEDNGAAELAGRFYAYRRETDDADALARAQREMLQDSRFRSPYYWAGYQLSGASR